MRSAVQVLKRLSVDLSRSSGARVVSGSGREYLDLLSNISSLPLGYNHPDLLALAGSGRFQRLAVHRQALNLCPTVEHEQHLADLYPRIAPFENAYLHLASSGSEAVESAVKYASRSFSKKHPGVAPLVLSLSGGFHGRTCGALSMTSTDPLHTVGFPRISSLPIPFPTSDTDEDACLESIDGCLRAYSGKACALVVEPVQCEGGDRAASPRFYRALRGECKLRSIPFIVDEVQTAMSTGRMWAHGHWDLPDHPDAVVFSKKLQIPGVYLSESLAPSRQETYAYNSTWAGDAMRGELLKTILGVVEREDLFTRSSRTGTAFFKEVAAMDRVTGVRNIGFLGSFDVDYRDSVVSLLQERGLLVAPSGPSAIRIRPPLNLTSSESSQALEILKGVLSGSVA